MSNAVGCVTTYGLSFECEKVDLSRWRLAFFRYLTKFEAIVVASDRCTAVWRVAQLRWVLSARVMLILFAEWGRKHVCRIVKKAWKCGCSLLPYCFFVVPDIFISLDDHLRLNEGVARLLWKTIVITLIDCWWLFVLFLPFSSFFFFPWRKGVDAESVAVWKDFYI